MRLLRFATQWLSAARHAGPPAAGGQGGRAAAIPPTATPPAANALAADSAVAAPRPLRALLVDDNPAQRQAGDCQLRRLGIEATLACNGLEALQQVASQRFDIVLMDVVMPEMDGMAATAAIRRFEREHPERARVPVVAFTASKLASQAAVMQIVGIDAVLQKPADLPSLQACLQRWCAARIDPAAH